MPISPIPVVTVRAQPGASSSSPAPVTASEAELRTQVQAAVAAALAEAGLNPAPVTERRSSTPAAPQSQTMRKLVELRERDVSFEEEAVQAWRGLGFSEEAARRAARGER